MKKLLVTLLILGIAAGAFAEFDVKATITADFNPEVMRITSPLGDAAKKEVPGASGTLDVLSSSANGQLGKENELRLALNWTFGETFAAYMRVNADRLIRPYQNSGSGQNALTAPGSTVNSASTSTTGHSFVNGEGKTADLGDFLLYSFDEWRINGRAGFLTAMVGNTGDRGKTNGYRFDGGFNDYLKVKIDNFGVMTPTIARYPNADSVLGDFDTNTGNIRSQATYFLYAYKIHDHDSNNPNRKQRIVGSGTPLNSEFTREQDQPYWALSLGFNDLVGVPLTFQVFGDIGYSGLANLFGSADVRYGDYSRFNGGVRISGEKLGSLVTFDATYKIRGGDPDTWDGAALIRLQPDGEGVTAHTFGLYTAWHMLESAGLGLSFGYTGHLRTYEDYLNSGTTKTYSGPLFHGIDLRFRYTGVPNLTITLNNAFTIAFAEGTTGSKEVIGLLGGDSASYINSTFLGEKEEERWLALYNALGFKYAVTNLLTLDLMIGNRLGMYNNWNDADTAQRTTINLGAGLSATYAFNSAVTMMGGLSFLYDSATVNTEVSGVKEETDSGRIYFAIPLRFRVVY